MTGLGMLRGPRRRNRIAPARAIGLAGAVATFVVLAAAPTALATQRFADPNGSTTGTCAPPDPPCTLQRAVEDPQTVDGDEVIVNPGIYQEGSNRVLIDNSITLHGAIGQPFPQIITTAPDAVAVQPVATTATVSRLVIEHTGISDAIFLGAGTAEQIIARSTRGGCELVATPAGTTLRDSVCWVNNSSSSSSAVFVSSSVTAVSNLRNVTAIATGPATQGIFVSGDGNGATTTVDARNVIARGGDPDGDVWADTATGATATVTLGHSNYVTENETGPGTPSVTDPGTGMNQTSSPIFANAATGDFHQLAGSPTINAGDAAASMLGLLDFDLEPRTVGPAPDIGADEYLDTDGDAVADALDNCPASANADQADNDGDGAGNVCDATPDGPPAEPEPEPVDSSAPTASITRHPKDKTKKKSATFEFTGTDTRAIASFQCSLDGAAFASCSSPHTVKVKKGQHTFQVRAVDQAGNIGTPGSDSWKRKKKKRKR